MRNDIKFHPPSYISMRIDWQNLVYKPFNEGRIIEAFATADAIIDDFIESCLRNIYSDHRSQDLINEIHFLRGRVNFDGMILLEILKSKTVVDETFVNEVRMFKRARNLVLHSKEGEYALILGNQDFKYSNQEELDKFVLTESRKWISNARVIFDKLSDICVETCKNPDYYFSEEFYKKNPRGKIAQKEFPNG